MGAFQNDHLQIATFSEYTLLLISSLIYMILKQFWCLHLHFLGQAIEWNCCQLQNIFPDLEIQDGCHQNHSILHIFLNIYLKLIPCTWLSVPGTSTSGIIVFRENTWSRIHLLMFHTLEWVVQYGTFSYTSICRIIRGFYVIIFLLDYSLLDVTLTWFLCLLCF